jgi:hypothetical protein
LSGVKVALVLLDLDGDSHDVIIELVVACDFAGQAPIIHVSHSLL